jgi:hypothetical protein
MRQATLTIPEVGVIAATRGMAGAGAALLLADRISPRKRRMLGWPLFLVGALSTIPILIDVFRKSNCHAGVYGPPDEAGLKPGASA